MYLWKVINSEKYAESDRTHSTIQVLIVLYLLKCLDIKKLDFRVQISNQMSNPYLYSGSQMQDKKL
jgi:hypothetical protein